MFLKPPTRSLSRPFVLRGAQSENAAKTTRSDTHVERFLFWTGQPPPATLNCHHFTRDKSRRNFHPPSALVVVAEVTAGVRSLTGPSVPVVDILRVFF